MAQKNVTIDGKEFSEETVKAALKKHCNFESDIEPKQVKVYCFRARRVSSGEGGYPYNLGCINSTATRWDGRTMHNDKGQIAVFTTSEVEQIIAGLEKLLDS